MTRDFRFFINGSTVQPPKNFEEFTEVLVRDETKRHVFYDYPISLEFIGSGYNALDAQYKSNYNSQVRFRVDAVSNSEPTQTLFDAFIKTSNITFDLIREVAICEIDDTTYQAYVFSNYSVEVGCGASTSKNGIEIDSIPNLELTVYNPITGVNLPDPRRAYDVFDAFTMVIDYISDGTLTTASTWYSGLLATEKIAICTGVELRNHEGRSSPIISLEDIFTELWKKYNLYLIIENPINDPIVRIEQESYLYGNSRVSIAYVENLTRSLDFDKLFSTLKIGSSKNIKERGATFLFPYLQLFSFVEETYNFEGVINVDNTLDLVSTWIIDTNVIEDVLVNDDESYDEDIFLIQYNSLTNTAVKGAYFNTTDEDSRLYNEQLLNSNVADRFNYLGNLVLQTSQIETGFKATQTTGLNFIREFNNFGDTAPVIEDQTWFFQDDSTGTNFDLGNNYDPTTGIFTAPGDGEYVFRSILQINTFGSPPGRPGFDFQLNMRVSVNGDTDFIPVDYAITQLYANNSVDTFTIDSEDETFTIPVGVEQTLIEIVQTRSMIEADEAFVRVELIATAVTALTCLIGVNGSTYELIASPLGGGTYVTKDAKDYYVGIYKADNILLSDAQWQIIRDNVNARVVLSGKDNSDRISYPKKISRNLVTGSTDIETTFNFQQPTI